MATSKSNSPMQDRLRTDSLFRNLCDRLREGLASSLRIMAFRVGLDICLYKYYRLTFGVLEEPRDKICSPSINTDIRMQH